MLKRIVLIVAIVVVANLYLMTPPISAASWEAPVAPSTTDGPYARNKALADTERLFIQTVRAGPEYLASDPTGSFYTGYADGSIVRINPNTGSLLEIANTGGRPLGMRPLSDGRLIVADAKKGLLQVDSAGKVTVLAQTFEGKPLKFVDDVVVTRDEKTAYFTDASSKFSIDDLMYDIMEHQPNGAVYAIDLTTHALRKVARQMYFPNGLVLMPDEQSLLVNETTAYRVSQVWVVGSQAGQRAVWADNLPGFPDNITVSNNGHVWVALVNPRNPLLDHMSSYPAVRNLVARLPEWARPQAELKAQAVGFDLQGKLRHYLMDDSAQAYGPVTTVSEVGPWLYLGSLSNPAVGRIKAPE